MSSIILHISDLHVSMLKDFDGKEINNNSFLVAEENDESLLFIERFTKFTKELVKNSTIYLLITGDITNRGEQVEFEYAKVYLDKIINELSINKSNILLIPGDHDLNRREIKNQIAQKTDSSLEEINDAKFMNFAKFYKDFINKDFNSNDIIVNNLVINDRIQLLGINSAYKVDLSQKSGMISIEKFENELIHYIENKQLKTILCCHHNIVSSYEDKKSGQWDINNRSRLLSKLQEKYINFVLSGNEHTSSLEKHGNGEITFSDSGPLTQRINDSTFKIYKLQINDDIIISNDIYGLVRTGVFENPYHWEKRSNSQCQQDSFINIFIKNAPIITNDITEITSEVNSIIQDSTSEFEKSEINIYENPFFSEELYKKVKKLNIFHSGHFHWSETSRAHNWIDISKLIENKDNLNFLKNAIIDVLETKIHPENIDLIIGLGYEGNILATKSAIKFNKPYSFLPYSYRHDEHHITETELNFDNEHKTYKNVLIITDVVNDGRTIRKLIKKRQGVFFSKVDKIYVISLFYTGESKLNNDILNFDFIKKINDYDLLTDEEVNNIEFYTVKSLKVEKCPYGANFREECFIYKDELSCVNLFYDESRYIQK